MPSDALSAWKARLYQGLRSLEARSQRRSLAEVRGVNFCSNDYLGLAENSELRAQVAEAVRISEKVGGTGSRLLSGQSEEWRELEDEFAKFAGTESALFFTTGYAANLGLIASLVGKDDVVFSDECNHASLIDGMRLSGARKVIYPHLNLNALEDALRRESNAPCRKLIVSESVFSMDGDIAPLVELATLAEKYGAALILDEAHATAVHGPAGHGLVAAAGITSKVLAIIHTCGKALASAGAFVCGPTVLKEHLLNHARTFIFSTAMPPYFAAQIRSAMRLAEGMNADRASLLHRAVTFRAALQSDLHEQTLRANAKNESNLERLSTERDSIVCELAKASGKLSAQAAQIEALERRAISAESRLEKEIKRRSKPRKSTPHDRRSEPRQPIGDH